jgi:putative flippase GtrA
VLLRPSSPVYDTGFSLFAPGFILYNKCIKQNIIDRLDHSSSRFFLVGITAFGVDYIVLLFLYYALGVNLEAATAIGFIAGFAISFTANKQWVFGSGRQKKKLTRQITEYAALVLFNFGFTVASVSLLNNYGIRPAIGKLIAMALVMCWNYTLFRWVIFTREAEPNP